MTDADHTVMPPGLRGLLTVCLMMATIMQALDTTIANVALPYMQGTLSATQDQVTWVLTSYIVAAAIMTAPVGWLAMRFGTKRVLIVCAAGFTVASMLCGIAQSLTDMVLYRLLQGVFGAALVPLSQAVMMAIYPADRRGQAMAIWGMGVMLGPILGPTLGAWLTETWTWRWVFFVNLPFGIATVLGLIAVMKETPLRTGTGFDWFGFSMLSLGIGALQLMLDRGETLGWFESNEVIFEAAAAAAGLYFFLAHSLTAAKPFIPMAMFRDRNFTVGVIFMFVVGMILLATLALVTPFLQSVVGYPILVSGYLLGSRGIGTLVTMTVVGRLLRFVDARILIFIGIVASTLSSWRFVSLAPETSVVSFVVSSVLQGIGLGLLFVPLNTIAFATLPPGLRTEATAVWSLIRNIGSSVGTSIVIAQLSSGTTYMHARLVETLQPWNLGLAAPGAAMLRPSTSTGAAMLDSLVTGQAVLLAYSNDFLMMVVVGLVTVPLLALIRTAPPTAAAPTAGHAD